MHFILHFLSVTQSKCKVITYIRCSHLDAFYKAQGEMAAVWSDSSHSEVDSQIYQKKYALKVPFFFLLGTLPV